MSFRPPFDKPRGIDDESPLPEGIRLEARIENMSGEERRLLELAHESRTRHRHERMKAIEHELHHLFEALAHRAHRRPPRGAAPRASRH